MSGIICPNCPNCRKNYDLDKDRLRLPRMLPCGHTFCERCLGHWTKLRQNRGFFLCSMCTEKKENYFDQASSRPLEGFAVDVYIVGLVSLHGLGTSRGAGVEACDQLVARFEASIQSAQPDPADTPTTPFEDTVCSHCRMSEAVGICPCGKFCQNCFKTTHARSKALSAHELRPLFQAECDNHAGAPIVLWCKHHSTALCSACFVSEHKQCSVISITEAHSNLTAILQEQQQQINSAKTAMVHADSKINHLLSKLKSECHESKEALTAHVCDLHSQLQNELNSLLQSLEGQGSAQLDQLLDAKKKLANRLKLCAKAERWSARATRPGAPTDLLLVAHEHMRKAVGTSALDFAIDESAPRLEFCPGDFTVGDIGVVQGPEARGVLLESTQPSSGYLARPKEAVHRSASPYSVGRRTSRSTSPGKPILPSAPPQAAESSAQSPRVDSSSVAVPNGEDSSSMAVPGRAAAVSLVNGQLGLDKPAPRQPSEVTALATVTTSAVDAAASTVTSDANARVVAAKPEPVERSGAVAMAQPLSPSPGTVAESAEQNDWTEVKVISLVTATRYIVQRTCDLGTIKSISDQLVAAQSQNRLPSLATLRKGELVAAQFSIDNRWYRARIKALPGDSSKDMPPPNTHAFVEYIDFGDTAWLHMKYLRMLPLVFQEKQALAHKCSLTHIKAAPTSMKPELFMAKVFDFVEQLVLEQHALFKVYAVDSNGVLHGDLRPVGSPVGLRDILVREKFAGTQPLPRPDVNMVEIVEGFVDVTVSHCVSPAEFYVQQAGDWSEMLQNTMLDMQAAFSKGSSSPDRLVVGGMYGALYSEDQQWYRVVVKELTFSDAVVQYIDYGNSENVQFSQIRQLPESFQCKPALATLCHAHDIRPTSNSAEWSTKAVEQWQDLCSDKDFVLTCQGSRTTDRGYPVLLIDTSQCEDKDFYPTQMLVEKGLAVAGMHNTMAEKSAHTQDVPVVAMPPSSHAASLEPAAGMPVQSAVQSSAHSTLHSATPSERPPLATVSAAVAPAPAFVGASSVHVAAQPPTVAPGAASLQQISAAAVSTSGLPSHGSMHAGNGTTATPNVPSSVPSLQGRHAVSPTHVKTPGHTGSVQSSVQVGQVEKGDTIPRDTPGPPLDELRRRHEAMQLSRNLEAHLHEQPRPSLPVSQWAREFGRSLIDADHCVLPTTAANACYLYCPHQFYVQLKTEELDRLEQVTELLNQLADRIAAVCPSPAGWKPTHLCSAFYEDAETGTGAWYRGQVMSVQGRNAQIYFVDYGNEETLSVGSLLPLPKDLAVLPPQAICCSLARLEAPDDTDTEGKVRACDEMADVVADSVFFDLLMLGEYDRERGVLPVDLLLSHDANLPAEHSLSDLLVLGGVLKEVSDLPATVPLHPYSAFQPPPDAEFSMRVTCVDDCGHLYGYEIPSGAVISPLHQMSEKLQVRMAELHKKAVPQRCWKGQCGCALADAQNPFWHRCSVVEILPDLKIKVWLVDHGRFEIVSILEFIDESFEPILPAQAIACTLANAQDLSADELAALRGGVLFKQCTVVRQDVGNVVEGAPLSVLMKLRSGEDVRAATLARMAEEAAEQEHSLVSQPSSASAEPPAAEAKPVARYVPPNRRTSTGASIEGNWRSSTLASIDEERTAPRAAAAADRSVAADSPVFMSGRATSAASLTDQHFSRQQAEPEQTVCEYANMRLPGVGERMEVSAVDLAAPNDLHVHVLSTPLRVRDACLREQATIATSCAGLTSNTLTPFSSPPAAGTLCMAQFQRDTSWHRAEVLSREGDTADVCFVDYGTCTRGQDWSSLRKIPRALCQIPRQAVRLVVTGIHAPGPPGSQWPDTTVTAVSGLLQGRELLAEVQATRSNVRSPLEVSLYVNGASLAELLVKANLARSSQSTLSSSTAATRVEVDDRSSQSTLSSSTAATRVEVDDRSAQSTLSSSTAATRVEVDDRSAQSTLSSSTAATRVEVDDRSAQSTLSSSTAATRVEVDDRSAQAAASLDDGSVVPATAVGNSSTVTEGSVSETDNTEAAVSSTADEVLDTTAATPVSGTVEEVLHTTDTPVTPASREEDEDEQELENVAEGTSSSPVTSCSGTADTDSAGAVDTDSAGAVGSVLPAAATAADAAATLLTRAASPCLDAGENASAAIDVAVPAVDQATPVPTDTVSNDEPSVSSVRLCEGSDAIASDVDCGQRHVPLDNAAAAAGHVESPLCQDATAAVDNALPVKNNPTVASVKEIPSTVASTVPLVQSHSTTSTLTSVDGATGAAAAASASADGKIDIACEVVDGNRSMPDVGQNETVMTAAEHAGSVHALLDTVAIPSTSASVQTTTADTSDCVDSVLVLEDDVVGRGQPSTTTGDTAHDSWSSADDTPLASDVGDTAPTTTSTATTLVAVCNAADATEQSSDGSIANPTEQSSDGSIANPTEQSSDGSTADPTQQSSDGSTAGVTQQSSDRSIADATEQSSDGSTADATQQSSDGSIANPTEQSSDGSIANPAEQSSDSSTADATEQSSDGSTADATEQSSDGSIANPTEQSSDGSIANPAEQSSDGSIANPAEQSSDSSTADATEQSSDGSTADATEQSSDGSIADATEQSSDGSIANPTEQSSDGNIANPTEQSSDGSIANPTQQSSDGSIANPTEQSSDGALTADCRGTSPVAASAGICSDSQTQLAHVPSVNTNPTNPTSQLSNSNNSSGSEQSGAISVQEPNQTHLESALSPSSTDMSESVCQSSPCHLQIQLEEQQEASPVSIGDVQTEDYLSADDGLPGSGLYPSVSAADSSGVSSSSSATSLTGQPLVGITSTTATTTMTTRTTLEGYESAL